MRERRTRFVLVASMAGFAIIQGAAAQTAAAKTVTNENRLFQRFIEDGAVTEGTWVEPMFSYAHFGSSRFRDQDLYLLGPQIAFNVAEDVELGGRLFFETLNPNPGGTESGFSDMELYGKVRLTTAPTQFSIGALLKFPTGDKDKGIGTGETDVAFFAGLRHEMSRVTLVGNAGLRINQDPDFPPPGSVEGEMSVSLGGAALFPMTQKLTGVVEASYETERFDGMGEDFRLTLGAEHRSSESFMARAGVAWGWGDGSPNFQILVSGVFLF